VARGGLRQGRPQLLLPYGLDGTLLARPDEGSFNGLDRCDGRLAPLPVVAKYGMVWVCPRMYVSLYTTEPALPDSARRSYSNNFGLLMATVEKQDFPVSNRFYSGTQDDIVFGRKGPAQQRRSRSHP